MTQLNLKLRVEGMFRIVLNSGTPREMDYGWARNLVLNQFFDSINNHKTNTATFASRVVLGTSTVEPTFTDTQLGNQTAASSDLASMGHTAGSADSPHAVSGTYSWTLGSLVGNFTEIGLMRYIRLESESAFTLKLMTRSLIKNEQGQPTTLTVTADDQLTIHYQLRITPLAEPISFQMDWGGSQVQAQAFVLARTFSGWTGSNFAAGLYTNNVPSTVFDESINYGTLTNSSSSERLTPANDARRHRFVWDINVPSSNTSIAGIRFFTGLPFGIYVAIKFGAPITKNTNQRWTTTISVGYTRA
jgi:hypothetical protein